MQVKFMIDTEKLHFRGSSPMQNSKLIVRISESSVNIGRYDTAEM